jgi:hypothetical protein
MTAKVIFCIQNYIITIHVRGNINIQFGFKSFILWTNKWVRSLPLFLALTSEHLDVCEKDQLGSTFQHFIVGYLSIFTILFWTDLFINISTSGMAVVYCAWSLSTGNLKQLVNRVYNSQAVGHVETFLWSALHYKSFHLKFSQNNFNFNILALRVLWLWTNNCIDLENWNWILVELIKFILFPRINGFFCSQN